MRFRVVLATASLLALTSTGTQAQPSTGPYLAVSGGANFLFDQTLAMGGGGITAPVEINPDYGWVAGIAGGIRFESGLRPEIEIAYRRNTIDEIGGGTILAGSYGGNERAVTFMANLLYDINLGTIVTPYLGFGVGGAAVKANEIELVPGGLVDFHTHNFAFAYQGIAGVSVRITDNLEGFVDYRYIATEGLDLDDTLVIPLGPFALGIPATLDDEYRSHTVMAGIRWLMDPPRAVAVSAPPMPAAPQPSMQTADVPRTYLVYFDFDSDRLDGQAQATVAEAATNILAGNFTRIEIVGHTDRAGPESYNIGLSQRRAQAVTRELQTNGVSETLLAVDWAGESVPRVPTPDGVRERENRRVEIHLPQ